MVPLLIEQPLLSAHSHAHWHADERSIAKRVLRAAAPSLSSAAVGRAFANANSVAELQAALDAAPSFERLQRLGHNVMQPVATAAVRHHRPQRLLTQSSLLNLDLAVVPSLRVPLQLRDAAPRQCSLSRPDPAWHGVLVPCCFATPFASSETHSQTSCSVFAGGEAGAAAALRGAQSAGQGGGRVPERHRGPALPLCLYCELVQSSADVQGATLLSVQLHSLASGIWRYVSCSPGAAASQAELFESYSPEPEKRASAARGVPTLTERRMSAASPRLRLCRALCHRPCA